MRWLQLLGDSLSSSEEVDEACAEEFMRLFREELATRSSGPLRWMDND